VRSYDTPAFWLPRVLRAPSTAGNNANEDAFSHESCSEGFVLLAVKTVFPSIRPDEDLLRHNGYDCTCVPSTSFAETDPPPRTNSSLLLLSSKRKAPPCDGAFLCGI
jgi:hypothetical protein